MNDSEHAQALRDAAEVFAKVASEVERAGLAVEMEGHRLVGTGTGNPRRVDYFAVIVTISRPL